MEVSQEKIKIVNVKRKYTEFLGFKIKLRQKGNKKVVKSNISDTQFTVKKNALLSQVKRIARPKKDMLAEIRQYNLMVIGIQNYYRIATHINLDFVKINRAIMIVITNRLSGISRNGRKLTTTEKLRFGKSKMLRFIADEPIYPIGYVQHKIPKSCCRNCQYKQADYLSVKLGQEIFYDKSIEYAVLRSKRNL